jgi:hypothetical protein
LQTNCVAVARNRRRCDVYGAAARRNAPKWDECNAQVCGWESWVQRFMVCIQRLIEKKTTVWAINGLFRMWW